MMRLDVFKNNFQGLLQSTGGTFLLLSLITYSFFGALAAIFALLASILFFLDKIKCQNNSRTPWVFFLIVTGTWWTFFAHGILLGDSETNVFIRGLGSSFSLVLVGSLILSTHHLNLKINLLKLANLAMISLGTMLVIYLIVEVSPKGSLVNSYSDPRLTLFSGHPVPFTVPVMSLGVMSLLNIQARDLLGKLVAIFFFFLAAYVVVFESGTRGQLVALGALIPLAIWYTSDSVKTMVLIFAGIAITTAVVFFLFGESIIESRSISLLISDAYRMLFEGKTNDRSEMWLASLKAIKDSPLLGYGIENRFNAITPYLRHPFDAVRHSHPHNDLLAGLLASGVIGGIATLATLSSPLLIHAAGKSRSNESLFLALSFTSIFFAIGMTNTMLFNEVVSSWVGIAGFILVTMVKSNSEELIFQEPASD